MKALKLQPDERAALQAFIRQILDVYPQQVVQASLFGSKARGDSAPEQGFTFYQNAAREAVNLTLKKGRLSFSR